MTQSDYEAIAEIVLSRISENSQDITALEETSSESGYFMPADVDGTLMKVSIDEITSAANDATTAAASATTAASTATTAAENADSATSLAQESASTATIAAESIVNTGGEGTEATFKTRTSTESGIAVVSSIKGNSLAWNQLVADYVVDTSYFSVAQSGDDVTLTALREFDSTGEERLIYLGTPLSSIVSGHVYLLRNNLLYGSVYIPIRYKNGTGWVNSSSHYTLFTCSANYTFEQISIGARNSNIALRGLTTGSTITFTGLPFELFDLTLIYGAGNEPTAETFAQDFPEDYYAYDAGSLVNFTAEGISSTTSSNTYTRDLTYIQGITDGTDTLFPEGLKSAGSAYDEVTPNKAYKRVGTIDLGTLTWTLRVDTTSTFVATIDRKATSGAGDTDVVCGKYPASARLTYAESVNYDKVVFFPSTTTDSQMICIVDGDYTDAATFKEAMSGVYLNYELATPVETDITHQIAYAVEEGGTEALLEGDGMTTELRADYYYVANVSSEVDGLPENYISKESFDNYNTALISALANVGITMTVTSTYDSTNKVYNYTITATN